jgi:hypothetical protein
MRRLLDNDYEAYTKDAIFLADRIKDINEELLIAYIENGYSVADIQYIIYAEIDKILTFAKAKVSLNKRMNKGNE